MGKMYKGSSRSGGTKTVIIKSQRRKRNYKRRRPAKYAPIWKTVGFPNEYLCRIRYNNWEVTTTGTSESYGLELGNVRPGFDLQYASSLPAYVKTLLGDGVTTDGESIYKKFVVYRTTVKFRVQNRNAAQTVRACLVALNDSAISGITVQSASERPFSSPVKLIGLSNGGNDEQTFYLNVPIHKLQGVPKSALSIDDGFHGTNLADPENDSWAYLLVEQDTGTLNVMVQYEMEFYIKFFDRQFESGPDDI